MPSDLSLANNLCSYPEASRLSYMEAMRAAVTVARAAAAATIGKVADRAELAAKELEGQLAFLKDLRDSRDVLSTTMVHAAIDAAYLTASLCASQAMKHPFAPTVKRLLEAHDVAACEGSEGEAKQKKATLRDVGYSVLEARRLMMELKA